MSVGLPEGIIAAPLGEVQKRYPDIDIGSYPFYRPGGNGVALVAKGTDAAAAEAAIAEVTADHRGLRQGADTGRAGGVGVSVRRQRIAPAAPRYARGSAAGSA